MSYQRLFDAAVGETPPSRVDVDTVVRRQRRAARVRPVLAGITALAAAAGIVTAIQLTAGGEDGGPPATVPADALGGFPEYLDGTRVIAAEDAPIGEPLTLTLTPPTDDLVLHTRCDGHGLDPLLGLRAEVTIGAAQAEVPYCPVAGARPAQWPTDKIWEALWAAAGVEIGEPITVTVTLTEVEPLAVAVDDLPPLPETGRFAVAVAQRVPFEDYPLPPAPAELPPLAPLGEPVEVELRAEPGDPNRPQTGTVPGAAARAAVCDSADPAAGDAGFYLSLAASTPGTLRVLADGVEIAVHSWWDYLTGEVVGRVCLPAAGDPVTIEVLPEHLTGDWRVALYR